MNAPKITIYHNPRCSKSRQSLALLTEKGIKPNIILYLEQPPSIQTLQQLAKQLDLPVAEMMRKKEAQFKECQLDHTDTTDQQRLAAMHEFPILIERPIIVVDDRAVIGRPPSRIEELLP